MQAADGQQYGPYPAAVVQQYVAEGRLDPATTPASVGGGAWAPLGPVLKAAGVDVPPAPPPPPPPSRPADDWWAKQVPTGNPPALAAYYLAVFGFIPCLGLLLTPFAIGLGIVGLKRANEYPESHGRGHALTGIIGGAISLVGHLVVIGLMAASG